MHWSYGYVGLPYERYDCAGLIGKVADDIFNFELRLPSERSTNAFGNTAMISAGLSEYATKVEEPREPDLVLMRTMKRLWHCGIFVDLEEKGYWCLHSLNIPGSVCLHKISDLWTIGCEVEGYYRWLSE